MTNATPNPSVETPNAPPSQPSSALGGEATPPATPQPNATPQAVTPGSTTTSVQIPENWKEALDPELKSEASLSTFKTIQDLAKSFVHAQKMIGKNKVALPDPKHATDDDWREFYFKVGLPQDESQYKVTTPDGEEVDEKFLDEFRKQAYQLNIMPAQAQKLFQWYLQKEKEYGSKSEETVINQVNQKLNEYKEKSGAAYNKRLYLAKKAITEFGDDALKEMVNNPLIGNNPAIIDTFYKIGAKLFGEDTIEGADQIQGGLSPEEATNRWNDIRSDMNHPYWQASHPNHKKAMEEVQKLFSYMHGNVPANASKS